MRTAKAWKAFYRSERESLGRAGLQQLIASAPRVTLPQDGAGAVVFPHTRLSTSGRLPAAVARAVIESGCETVLALGVLHGAREEDAPLVQRARGGNVEALRHLRRAHGPGVPGDRGHWSEEFSLDNFQALVEIAAEMAGVRPPRIIARYPFLTGPEPSTMPGLDELRHIIDGGAALVATTDPIHEGVGYGTAAKELLPRESEQTFKIARQWIQEGFTSLARRDYRAFLENARAVRSDFRDVGPVMVSLLEPFDLSVTIHELLLVDYHDVLQCAQPTWVAAALASIATTPGASS
jgi:hypothetical protein